VANTDPPHIANDPIAERLPPHPYIEKSHTVSTSLAFQVGGQRGSLGTANTHAQRVGQGLFHLGEQGGCTDQGPPCLGKPRLCQGRD